MKSEKPKVTLHVLNDFLKFDRKIYQLFGLSLGRPIKLKTVLYFLGLLVIELVIYFTPVIGILVNWMPAIFLILFPASLAYLLSDIRTEGRSSLAFFRSVFLYHIRKLKRVTYFRGREISKPASYKFVGYSTIANDQEDDELNPRKVNLKIRANVSTSLDQNY